MRVFHVSVIKQVAGAERYLLWLLPGLRARGIDAQLAILNIGRETPPPQQFIDALEAQDLPYHRITTPPITSVIHPNTLRTTYQLSRFFREYTPDVVHTHLYHADLLGIPAARLAGVSTTVSTRHNVEAYRGKRLWRGLGSVTSRVIAISNAVSDYTKHTEGVASERINVIYHGIPLEDIPNTSNLRTELNIPPDAPVVGTVARLTEQKGVRYALQAFAEVHQHIPAAHYIIAGDGELRDELKSLANALNVQAFVHFLGWRDDPHEALAALDVFLLPSLWEGFGIVFLEAMAHRLPIISTHIDAIPEIVTDGETGYLVPKADADALLAALKTLLNDRQLVQKMGDAGRNRLERHFSLDRMIDQTITTYQQARQK